MSSKPMCLYFASVFKRAILAIDISCSGLGCQWTRLVSRGFSCFELPARTHNTLQVDFDSNILQQLQDNTCGSNHTNETPYKECSCIVPARVCAKENAVSDASYQDGDEDEIHCYFCYSHLFFTFLFMLLYMGTTHIYTYHFKSIIQLCIFIIYVRIAHNCYKQYRQKGHCSYHSERFLIISKERVRRAG